jgi:hypothetical protein
MSCERCDTLLGEYGICVAWVPAVNFDFLQGGITFYITSGAAGLVKK